MGASRGWAITCLLLLVACRPSSSSDSGSDSNSDAGDEDPTTAESETESGDTGEPEEGWHEVLRSTAETGGLWSVFGHTPDEVLAVGGQVGPGSSTGIVAVRDAMGEWAFEDPGMELAGLTWVSGYGEGYVVAGRTGTVAVRDADGVWERLETGSAALLWGIWGPSDDELYAVGTDTTSDTPVLLARSGGAFEPVTFPETQLSAASMFKVWGRNAEDIVVVGDLGWLLGFDGTEWTEHDSGATGDLISVWGTDTATVAVGGRSNARVVTRLEGPGPDAVWRDHQLQEPGLSGIFIDGDGRGTAVGDLGTILTFDAADLAGDDPTFAKEPSPTPLLLHGVFGFSNGLRIAVGGNLGTAPPYVGIIIESTD